VVLLIQDSAFVEFLLAADVQQLVEAIAAPEYSLVLMLLHILGVCLSRHDLVINATQFFD
jgi:hypothetical protein